MRGKPRGLPGRALPSRGPSRTSAFERQSRVGKATSGSEKRLRKHAVAVRLLDDEADALNAAADRAGLSVGAYLRVVALGAAGPRAVRRAPIERQELVRVLAALGQLGSNVNQLARRANATGEIGDTALMQKYVMEMRDAVLMALGRDH